MRKRAINAAAAPVWRPDNDVDRSPIAPSLTALGQVVYAVRTKDGLVKIGCTADLARRARQVGSGMKSILAWQPGTFADEAAAHSRLKPSLARGRETYNPSAEVVAFVNELRSNLGVRPIDSI